MYPDYYRTTDFQLHASDLHGLHAATIMYARWWKKTRRELPMSHDLIYIAGVTTTDLPRHGGESHSQMTQVR
jgi:hypothetical protein